MIRVPIGCAGCKRWFHNGKQSPYIEGCGAMGAKLADIRRFRLPLAIATVHCNGQTFQWWTIFYIRFISVGISYFLNIDTNSLTAFIYANFRNSVCSSLTLRRRTALGTDRRSLKQAGNSMSDQWTPYALTHRKWKKSTYVHSLSCYSYTCVTLL